MSRLKRRAHWKAIYCCLTTVLFPSSSHSFQSPLSLSLSPIYPFFPCLHLFQILLPFTFRISLYFSSSHLKCLLSPYVPLSLYHCFSALTEVFDFRGTQEASTADQFKHLSPGLQAPAVQPNFVQTEIYFKEPPLNNYFLWKNCVSADLHWFKAECPYGVFFQLFPNEERAHAATLRKKRCSRLFWRLSERF